MKSRKIGKWGLVFFGLGLVLLSVSPFPVHANGLVKIRPGQEYQTMEGFGTSLAWWANVVGGWQDDGKKRDILDSLFTTSSGIGLKYL